MKPLRSLISVGLWIGITAAAGAAEGKALSYSLAGFCTQGKPSDELVQRAAKAVEARTAGMTITTQTEYADHYVEVVFRRDSFEVYVDALPFKGSRVGASRGLPYFPMRIDYGLERAEDKRCEPKS